jgi:hypothetical protein
MCNSGMSELNFADLTWQPRWNQAAGVAALSQIGADVMATNFMGVLRFRLDQDADVAAIVNCARRFADLVEETKREYDAAVLPRPPG